MASFLLAVPPKSYMHESSPHACYMPCQSHPPWLDQSNYPGEIHIISPFPSTGAVGASFVFFACSGPMAHLVRRDFFKVAET
jgi:hypothetical protein